MPARAGFIGVSFVLLLSTAAVAGNSGDWKDGCPPYFAPENADHDYAGLPTRGGVDSFGTPPEIDSNLAPTRIAVGGWASRLLYNIDPLTPPTSPAQLKDAATRSWLEYGRIVGQFNTSTGATISASYAAATSFGGDGQFEHAGNLQAYIGYRHATYVLGDAFRLGGAVRFGGGASLSAESAYPQHQKLLDDLEELAIRSPFSTQLFAFDRPLTLSFETRFEMVGCHSPFVHLRAEVTTFNTQVDDPSAVGHPQHPRGWVIPMSLTLGGYVEPWLALYGQAGVELRSPMTLLVYGHATRVGLGSEIKLSSSWLVDGRVNVVTGDVEGVEFAVTMSFPFAIKDVVQ